MLKLKQMKTENKLNKNVLQRELDKLLSLYNSKRFADSEKKVNELIRKFPKVPGLKNILGLIHTQNKKFSLAIESFEDAINTDPNFSMAYNNLGNVHKIQGNKELAIKIYKLAIKKNPNNPMAYNNLANLYKTNNELDKSINIYNQALKINPDQYIIYNNLGIAYKIIGNFKEAKECFMKAIKLKPDFYFAYRNLGQVIKWKKNDANLLMLQKVFNEHKKRDEIKREIAFTLAKAYEDIKDYKSTYSYLSEGNLIAKNLFNYSIKKDEGLFSQIKETFNEKLFNRYSPSANRSNNKNIPIFIVGMPRSGTTLIEQMLSKHSKIFATGETEILSDLISKHFLKNNEDLLLTNKFDFKIEYLDEIGNEYIKNLKLMSDNSIYITDKLPFNFRWIGLIKLILPNAKIIHCTRNSKDICFSIYKNFFYSNGVAFAYDFDDIINYYSLYENLMNHWQKTIPNFIFDVRYENLIENPKIEIEKLLKYLQLDWEDGCLNFYHSKRPVHTLSDTQVRKPLYKDSIRNWKNFEKYLPKNFKSLKS